WAWRRNSSGCMGQSERGAPSGVKRQSPDLDNIPGFMPRPRLCTSGLAWMVLAQLLFAGMNICTRLGSIRVPWPEVASARFLVGAVLAAGVAAMRGTSLQIIDQPGAWRRSIFVALLSGPLLDEPVGRRVWLAVALGFTGILALVRPSFALALSVDVTATA